LAAEANRRRHGPSLRRQGALALALVAGGAGTPCAIASPTNQSFRVTVMLNAPVGGQGGQIAQCANTLDSLANKVTIACGNNGGGGDVRPNVPHEIPRYLLHVYRAGEWLVDDQMGTGTLTSWRIVHVANREYLEMTVGW
jgi:hypothetical protein